ncbi:PREDICTED: putative elongator complex protein 1 isoform X1 [Acromyrmex echinatior]|uniref:Elongator complex protein 1 n=3 Tax=Acromyrmex echinatior TaxID=103372 RepID=F4W5N3_ACREC|nr:PREDICTED: putative elongator complex protein 1 isoform X1 [Acromyrmex echinatior]EGI70530.1 Elongator complex protein 1 [Acromyrmex echinatior]
MRNLTIRQVNSRNVKFMENIKTNQELLKRIQCAINPSFNDIYVLLDEHLSLISSERKLIDVDNPEYSLSKIVTMDYCVALQELYCAYESGCLAKIMMDETHIDYNMILSDINLQCMKFSPDHEIIAAVTTTGVVITMVLNFQVMSEVDLYSEEFGQNEFVTVGWGKKETQFHGSVGKSAAQAKPIHLIPNELDDGRIRITWRDDGTFFAISFLHKETKIRRFKIFNREGMLCYTCEQINGLEECIAWGPMERPIAIPQILDEKYVIAFFEKNGLKYSDLLLPFKPQEAKVRELLWSPCSDILAVVCYQSKTNTTLIQLWTENNGHWYLKQTLVFTEKNPLLYVTWSDRINQFDEKELIYLTTKELTFCLFNWCVNHSRGKTVDDKVVIGVIDGNNILVTGFKDGIIPPPMAHQYLHTSESQNAIVFAPEINDKSSLINSNEFCTVSCNNKLMFFKQIKESSTLTYEVINSYSIDFGTLYDIECDVLKTEDFHYYTNNFLWFTKDIMLFCTVTNNHNLLCVLSLDKESSSKNSLTIQKIYVLDYPIEHIISSNANTAYIKAKEQIFKYTRDGKFEQTNITLSKLCAQLEIVKINSDDVILALSLENSFFINGKETAKNITSFYVHSDFVILTTLQHTLVCVPLNEVGLKQLSVYDLTVKPWLNTMDKMSLTDIYIRRLEKDSRIITAILQDSKVILQMPRGNLECIQPRALSLHILKFYLDNCNYLTALDIMTKQRINLNLIYDHNPQLFIDNVKKFVEDIIQHKKLNWLNLYLSELQDENVISTMYANCYVDHTVKSDIKSNETNDNEIVNKVDKICKLLRDVMEKHHDADNLIQPILISLVKNQQRQGLENALSKIKQVKTLEESQKLTVHKSSVSAYEALKYLLHFVNIDVLYDTALGMYDFELAMFIASKSSKDPKEYVPFLNNLKKLNTNYMKYSINVYLKRYESALEFLSKEPAKFEECLDFIHSQKLYKMAMKLFEKSTIEHKKVAEIYGEYLSNEQKYFEAGMMFYRSGNLDKALETFSMSSDNWEDVITILKEMKLSPVDLHEHYKVLVEHLKAGRKYEHAAVILKEYLNDIEEAVAVLCEGRIWKHAIRITIDVQRLDLNETHIKPGVKEHAEHVISQLSKMKTDFLSYKSRLAVVRTEMKAKQTQLRENIYNDELEYNKEIPDSISDTISIADSVSSRMSQLSMSSSKSYRSSKNRRKQARKLLNLKKGSMFEDLGLIHALYQIISNAYKDRDEWYQLMQVLIRFEFDESAVKILVEEKEFFELVENSKPEIWDKSAPTSLADIEKSAIHTQAQLQEIIAPIKLMERYIMFPPEADTPPRVLNIF